MKKGFTLVELLVVIGMLVLLMGAVTSSVAQARKRAQITKATVAVQELTNAILAYERYVREDGGLPNAQGVETTENNVKFLLSKGPKTKMGEVPILYNAEISRGAIRDPWGTPYRYTIRKKDNFKIEKDELIEGTTTGLFFPNFNRPKPLAN